MNRFCKVRLVRWACSSCLPLNSGFKFQLRCQATETTYSWVPKTFVSETEVSVHLLASLLGVGLFSGSLLLRDGSHSFHSWSCELPRRVESSLNLTKVAQGVQCSLDQYSILPWSHCPKSPWDSSDRDRNWSSGDIRHSYQRGEWRELSGKTNRGGHHYVVQREANRSEEQCVFWDKKPMEVDTRMRENIDDAESDILCQWLNKHHRMFVELYREARETTC